MVLIYKGANANVLPLCILVLFVFFSVASTDLLTMKTDEIDSQEEVINLATFSSQQAMLAQMSPYKVQATHTL